jgi:hypothetical protein
MMDPNKNCEDLQHDDGRKILSKSGNENGNKDNFKCRRII